MHVRALRLVIDVVPITYRRNMVWMEVRSCYNFRFQGRKSWAVLIWGLVQKHESNRLEGFVWSILRSWWVIQDILQCFLIIPTEKHIRCGFFTKAAVKKLSVVIIIRTWPDEVHSVKRQGPMSDGLRPLNMTCELSSLKKVLAADLDP